MSRKIISKNNCFQLTGFSWVSLLNMIGFQAIHSSEQMHYLISNNKIDITIENNLIDIYFDSFAVEEFIMRIDLNKKKFYVVSLITTGKVKNLSFGILTHQQYFGRKNGFERIVINAEKAPGKFGYLIWGKYGFLMFSHYNKNFQEELKGFDTRITSIFELVRSEAGYKFWKDNGWSWGGYFDLNLNSQNMKIYRVVRNEKLLQQRKLDL